MYAMHVCFCMCESVFTGIYKGLMKSHEQVQASLREGAI